MLFKEPGFLPRMPALPHWDPPGDVGALHATINPTTPVDDQLCQGIFLVLVLESPVSQESRSLRQTRTVCHPTTL